MMMKKKVFAASAAGVAVLVLAGLLYENNLTTDDNVASDTPSAAGSVAGHADAVARGRSDGAAGR